MRLRWLLLLVLMPSIAAAHRLRTGEPYRIGAATSPGLHAGTLVLAFHNPNDLPIDVPMRARAGDEIVVELANATATTTRTLHVGAALAVDTVQIEPHGVHLESIDLDPLTSDLPPGDYDVHVIWHDRYAATTTFAPWHCGLVAPPPEPPSSPSKLPYVLGALASIGLLAAWRIGRRGAGDARMPHSLV